MSSSSKRSGRSSGSGSSSSKGKKRDQTGARHDTPEPGPELKFFMYSDPAEAKTADNKKLVRSHVARTSHAKSRRSREAGEGSSKDPQSSGYFQPEHLAYYDDVGGDGQIESSLYSASSSSVTYQRPTGSATQGYSSYSSSFSYSAQVPQSSAFTGQLSSWEQYLLDHYITILIPSRHNPCDHPRHSIDVALYRRSMTTHWVNFCLTDLGLLQGIFLASCRNLVKSQRRSGNHQEADMYEQRALQYKGECLRSMREAMPEAGQPVTDNVIGMTLFFAFNEYMAGDYNEARKHMSACEYMVDMKGGYHTLGLEGFLSQLIQWFKQELAQAGGSSSSSSSSSRGSGKRRG
ncbi:hypothetical protein M406DRAFT_72789 [Cryphonectria parasitica EP155]|uniref:Uncharacterized protein n=1 Tax=Cryphonectria parasitica (strain ATCC 38755 / EP155) TaxID=660469 RepID=A0A9P5CME0_CRYP1|nr:uncharacterized protein M406DRAFT_72789 [Cryphonectria parasitica EP155]KAF3762800.1 hypothetical protein M406DRAFT_72789 [Cryphonectria parasitica EP155]